MELFDVYNKDRVKTGETMVRGEAFRQGCYHLVTLICIFDSQGNMLIQQRQASKDGWPNLWDLTAGGNAVAGETSQAAAQRELFEEIGYRMDFQNIRPHLTVNFERSFVDFYLVKADVSLESLRLQPEEVQDIKWASQEEILDMVEAEEFVPYYQSLIRLLFEMRSQYGVESRQKRAERG